jgi:hypothetical protein
MNEKKPEKPGRYEHIEDINELIDARNNDLNKIYEECDGRVKSNTAELIEEEKEDNKDEIKQEEN